MEVPFHVTFNASGPFSGRSEAGKGLRDRWMPFFSNLDVVASFALSDSGHFVPRCVTSVSRRNFPGNTTRTSLSRSLKTREINGGRGWI